MFHVTDTSVYQDLADTQARYSSCLNDWKSQVDNHISGTQVAVHGAVAPLLPEFGRIQHIHEVKTFG